MPIFYVPNIAGNGLVLDPTESKHCVKVLRLNPGDLVQLIDGKGGFYKAKISEANPKACKLEIISKIEKYGKRNFHLHIAIAPTKNIDRFEWFLEKSTEIGIDEITPIICQYSERKVIKPERLNKILISAIKQSKNAYLPKLNDQTIFNNFIKSSMEGETFIAHCYKTKLKHLKDLAAKNGRYTIMIGPEGDFSEEEVNQALKAGFKEISLGKSRLRTETAGVVACHTINILNV